MHRTKSRVILSTIALSFSAIYFPYASAWHAFVGQEALPTLAGSNLDSSLTLPNTEFSATEISPDPCSVALTSFRKLQNIASGNLCSSSNHTCTIQVSATSAIALAFLMRYTYWLYSAQQRGNPSSGILRMPCRSQTILSVNRHFTKSCYGHPHQLYPTFQANGRMSGRRCQSCVRALWDSTVLRAIVYFLAPFQHRVPPDKLRYCVLQIKIVADLLRPMEPIIHHF
jgi:hypothetical protein